MISPCKIKKQPSIDSCKKFPIEKEKAYLLSLFPLAAPDRLELTTLRLTAECSTIRRGLYGVMSALCYLVNN